MIAGSVITPEQRQFSHSSPEFRLDPPGDTPLVATITDAAPEVGSFDLILQGNPIQAETSSSERVLDDILARAQRDVERYPSNAQARANFGIALLNRGRLDDAERSFLFAIRLSHDDYSSLEHLARIRILQGRFDEAERGYEDLNRRFPRESGPLNSLALLALRRADFEGASVHARNALRLEPTSVLPRILLSIVHMKLGNPREAIAQLRAASKIDSRSPAIYQALGIVYVIAGESGRAVRAFKTALSLAPAMVGAVHALANVLLSRNETGHLVDLLTAHLARTPNDLVGRELLAEAYLKEKRYGLARAQYLVALEVTRSDDSRFAEQRARILNNIAVCFDRLGDSEQATRWVQRSIDTGTRFELIPHRNLALFRIRGGHFDEAEHLLEACRAAVPQDHATAELQAMVFIRQKRYDDAITFLQHEVASGRASDIIYSHLGWLLSEAKRDLSGSENVMTEGLVHHPSSVILKNNLAHTLLLRGQVAKARKILESIPSDDSTRSVEEKVVVSATWGLLSLWEGDFDGGKQGYLNAERISQGAEDRTLANIVKQKMHLELARAYLRVHKLQAAQYELRKGLSVRQGRDFYEADLHSLQEQINRIDVF